MWWPAYAGVVVVVVRRKVRQSYISRTDWPGIAKFYKSLHIVYTRFKILIALCVYWNKFIHSKFKTGGVYKDNGYDVTIYFRSEVIGVRKTAENDASEGFNLESPKLAHTSTPASWTATLDMTSLTTSSWQLSKFNKRSMASQSHIPRTVGSRITKFYEDIHTDLSYICTGYCN